MLKDKEIPLISYGKNKEQEKRGGPQVVINAALSSTLLWVSWNTQGYLLTNIQT